MTRNRRRELAELLASKLTDDELLELHLELDGDRDGDFEVELAAVLEKRNPKLYAKHFITETDNRKKPV